MHTVTFYSYKGGVGRSLLVANCAVYLAQLGFRVVALDLDLEAPGLHYKFRAALPEGFEPRRGVVDLIDDYATKNELYESLSDASFEVPLGDPILEPNDPVPRGQLRVIPAGSAPSLDYWRRVANIDWKRFLYDEGATGVEFFVDLRDRIAEEFTPDILLIDSRTGITEIGNVATSVLADKVVCIVADTAENLEGARAVLRGLRRHRRLSDEAPIEMKIAVSRPHVSLPLAERLERIRAFLEEPADMLDATLDVGAPYPLAYEPEVEQKEQLMVSAAIGQSAQLNLDYIALAEELVPEALWSGIRTALAPRVNSPFPYSVWSYSRLALQQPGVHVDGLYRVGRRCFIVIPGFSPEMRASDGNALSKWFDSERVLGTPVAIVSSVPDGSIRVPDPSLEDLVELRDYPRTSRRADIELSLRLPRTFPRFRCPARDGSGFDIEVERPLLADERAVLRREFASLSYGSTLRLAIRVDVSVAAEESKSRFQQGKGDMGLIPSRWLPSTFSKAVQELVARDEEVWMSSRHAIYRGEISDPSSVLPSWGKKRGARLLAGSGGFTVPHARRLLPFCDQLVVDCPLSNKVDSDLATMGFTRKEFITLAGEGRILVLLSQSTVRYAHSLLNDLAREAPESLVCSRALCAATMIELRRRLYPWFFPEFDLRERCERLRRASSHNVDMPNSLSSFLPPPFSKILSWVWSREEMHTHHLGAMASYFLGGGFGTLLSEQIQHDMKRDLMLESMTAGGSVERAAALGAVVVPMHRPEFSLLGLTTLGAGLLSSLSNPLAHAIPSIKLDLPDHEQPALDLARLDGDELQQMRALISTLIGGGGDTSSAKSVVKACNRWLALVGVSTGASAKLIFSAPRHELGAEVAAAAATADSAGLDGGVAFMRNLREAVAGADPARIKPGIVGPSSSFPSIVVGRLEPSGRLSGIG